MGSEIVIRYSRFEQMGKEENEELFPFPTQLPPLEFRSSYSTFLPIFDVFSLMEIYQNDPLYESLNIAPTQEDFLCDFKSGFERSNEMINGFGSNSKTLLLRGNNDNVEECVEEKWVRRRRNEKREGKGFIRKSLSRKTISQYFYMPISQAAKELNVGLTMLKKRCRELGIRRWPHRKLMSLQTLINNVQEWGKGEGEEENLREAIGKLEEEKKLVEDMPDLELEEKTKRLRQACFKANFRNRKHAYEIEDEVSVV